VSTNRSCLIVGAGIAGLTAAAALEARGWAVVLLDKGRGPGGRMATRRIGESRLDHGAQFFTVRDARFREAANRWEQAGWVAPWFAEGRHVRYRAEAG
jgi:predicted NAD/FAD-dependent oxidoreductase